VIIRLAAKATAKEGWPEAYDKTATDNYPPLEEMDENDPVGVASLKVKTGTISAPVPGASSASTSRASKRGGEGSGRAAPAKRSRVEAL